MSIVGINDMPKNARYVGKRILLDIINKQRLIELTYFFNKNYSFVEVNILAHKIFVSKCGRGSGHHYNFVEIFENLGLKHSGVFDIPEGYVNKGVNKNISAPTGLEATLEKALYGVHESNIWL